MDRLSRSGCSGTCGWSGPPVSSAPDATDDKTVAPGAIAATRSSEGSPWTFLVLVAVGLAVSPFGMEPAHPRRRCGAAGDVPGLFHPPPHLSIAALRSAPIELSSPILDTGYQPGVTVLVACKNEESVVERLLESLLRLDYPAALLEFVIGTTARPTGPARSSMRAPAESPVRVVHRDPGASGGKSGALNVGLALALGEVIVVFDADHQPHPDVVRRLVRHFEDPAVAAVQGRCVIRNPEDSMLTKLVAIDYQAGYLVNEYGRQCIYELPAYGGANCAVRATELRAAGGWNDHSVTEDTDLTLRLMLAGRRVRYDVTAVDEEEGVVTLGRYWRQRYRWARGHQQVWRDYRRAVWRSPRLSAREKVETTMFLLGFHVPVVSAVGLGILVLWSVGARPPDRPPQHPRALDPFVHRTAPRARRRAAHRPIRSTRRGGAGAVPAGLLRLDRPVHQGVDRRHRRPALHLVQDPALRGPGRGGPAVSRNVPVVARVILVIVADIGGFVLFQHDARVAETWLASELAGLIGLGRFSVVKGTSVLVTPLHQTPFFVLVTSSCSSISSVCSIACLACLLRGVPLARRTLALLAAVAAVVVGNVVRIAASLTVGLASGRIALVLFHDWVGSTFRVRLHARRLHPPFVPRPSEPARPHSTSSARCLRSSHRQPGWSFSSGPSSGVSAAQP